MGDDTVGGGDLRGAGVDDSLDRVRTDSHNTCRDDYDESDQKSVLGQILTVLFVPQGPQQLHRDYLQGYYSRLQFEDQAKYWYP
jgi:hypothetical protein